MEQVVPIAAVMSLLMASLWWLRRCGVAKFSAGRIARKAPRNLELLERLPLAPQHSLHLVRLEGRKLLIGVSPAGCALLESQEVNRAASGNGGAA